MSRFEHFVKHLYGKAFSFCLLADGLSGTVADFLTGIELIEQSILPVAPSSIVRVAHIQNLLLLPGYFKIRLLIHN
ncbi:MAG: hypothetical protein WD491_05790 [Balneolales bacterium]